MWGCLMDAGRGWGQGLSAAGDWRLSLPVVDQSGRRSLTDRHHTSDRQTSSFQAFCLQLPTWPAHGGAASTASEQGPEGQARWPACP